MQGTSELESNNRLRFFEQAIQKIKEMIDTRLNGNENLHKLLEDLKENKELIESILDSSPNHIQLSSLVTTGKETLTELESALKAINKNMAAFLKSEIDKINNYYSAFLTNNNSIAQPITTFQFSRPPAVSGEKVSIDKLKIKHFEANTMIMLDPRGPKDKLFEMWNVPPKNINFAGRSDIIQEIENYFKSQIENAEPLILTAFHGLGGIGKTEVALRYLWGNYKLHTGTCWFHADTKEQLMAEYIRLGEDLNLFDEKDKSSTIENKALRVKTWLENQAPKGWLLVYDNPHKYDDIAHLLPVKGGHILITSRHTEWPGRCFPVNLFTLAEAKEFAIKIIGIEKIANHEENLNKLIDMLGRLPLALAQAFAFISKIKTTTIAEYIALYEKSRMEMLACGLLPIGNKHESVAVTWNITLDKMQEENADSVRVIYIACYLFNEGIPNELFSEFFSDEGIVPQLTTKKASMAIRVAEEYSMIKVNEQQQTISIHVIAQLVVRNKLTYDRILLEKLGNTIIAIYPDDQTTIEQHDKSIKLIVHLESLISHYKNLTPKNDDEQLMVKLTETLARAKGNAGDWDDQIKMYKRILQYEEGQYGRDDYRVAITLYIIGNKLAEMKHTDAEKNEGIRCLLRALKIMRQQYQDSSILITTLFHIATTLGYYHRHTDRIEVLLKALELVNKPIEYSSLSLSVIYTDIGFAYGAIGDYQNKFKYAEKAYNLRLINPGDLTMYFVIMGNLANAYGSLGDGQKEREYFERMFDDFAKNYDLKKKHPHFKFLLTIIIHSYDSHLDKQDVCSRLEVLLKLVRSEKYFGPNHPYGQFIEKHLRKFEKQKNSNWKIIYAERNKVNLYDFLNSKKVFENDPDAIAGYEELEKILGYKIIHNKILEISHMVSTVFTPHILSSFFRNAPVTNQQSSTVAHRPPNDRSNNIFFVLQSLFAQAKSLIDSNQDYEVVQVIFNDNNLVRQFIDELQKLGIKKSVLNNDSGKPTRNLRGDRQTEYIILMSADEYNRARDDKDAYAKLISESFEQHKFN